ncbi:MAG: zinc-ribbon domain-containing protein [Williamsia sp.]|nr:zinc-ribbon domain-containing protein [Williamsia sp.]
MKIKCPRCPAVFPIAPASLLNGIPTVKCPACYARFKPAAATGSESGGNGTVEKAQEAEAEAMEIGWLIVYEQEKDTQLFSLVLGKQTVGRKSVSRPATIMIETKDKYLSRRHFCIEVKAGEKFGFIYLLSNAMAKNPTRVNTPKDETKIVEDCEEYLLADGDSIQAGITKIIFKNHLYKGNGIAKINQHKSK